MFNIDDCMAFIITDGSKTFSEVFQKSLKEYNLTRSQWLALYFLLKYPNLNQIKLANLMSLKGPTVVKLLQVLESERYVKRVSSEDDKREKDIILLAKGQEKVEDLMPVVEKFKNDIVEGIDEEELETTKKVLEKMVKNAKKMAII